jgi:hypothetical protein
MDAEVVDPGLGDLGGLAQEPGIAAPASRRQGSRRRSRGLRPMAGS